MTRIWRFSPNFIAEITAFLMFNPALQCRDTASTQHKGGAGSNPRRLLIFTLCDPGNELPG